jgi:ABC-2 type transport system ATP-binding protein
MDQKLALHCRDLHKHYGQHKVLTGVNLAVEQASIHGLVGLNGAGKTTTMECLLGLRPKDKGEVSVIGFQPQELYRAQGKVAVVFDSPCLHPQLTVHQALAFARLNHSDKSLSIEEIEQQLGIQRYAHFKVRQLSLGNRRRTAIAQALINRPEFIILDEPFNGLDAGGVDDVLKLIRHLNRQFGTSFLLASHQLAYLENICSHVAILHAGKICLSQPIDSLLSQDKATVALTVTDPNQAKVVLSQINGIDLLSEASDAKVIHCRLKNISSAELNTTLVQLGIAVEQLVLRKPSLESLFYSTIRGEAA